MSSMNDICVFDFETLGAKFENDGYPQPVQLAAVMVDGRRLTVKPNSEFNTFIRPDLSRAEERDIEWHCKIRGCDRDELIKLWESGQSEEVAWSAFCDYVNKYNFNKNKTSFGACIPGGYNILGFDLPICRKLEEKYGLGDNKALFHKMWIMDGMQMTYLWLHNNPELKSYSMDSLRKYFQMPDSMGHDALVDVTEEAEIIIRYLRLMRRLSNNISFAGSFAESK